MKNIEADRMNPCLKEQELSYLCLSKNNYERAKCEPYFDNYNTCKKFWAMIYSERRAKGIHPYMPEPEDRKKIKEDFRNALNSQK